MPFVLIRRYFFLGCYFALISSCDSTLSYTTDEMDYNYAIVVNSVERCPMNKTDWKTAAEKTRCTGSRGYHCVPDKYHSKLIEFCYNKTRILVAEGNCLELAANGILNHVKCKNFTFGCPDKPYFSDEIYKYPACLIIDVEFGCFTSNMECFHQRFSDLQKQRREPTLESIPTNCELWKILFIVSLVLFVGFLTTLVVLFIIRRYGKRRQNIDANKAEQEQMIKMKSKAGKREDISERGPHKSVFPADLNVLEEVESELIVDITYLSQLLRRHCRNGTFKNFQYLLKRRILDKKDDYLHKILTSHDKDGYALLHCAAEGGSVDIFEALINATNEIHVEDKTYDGRTVLHIACKNKHISLCRVLLLDNNYKKLLLNEKTKTDWSAAHFMAAGGSITIFNLLEDSGMDFKTETKNGLNILDIACLHGHNELCKLLLSRDDLNLPLNKTDVHGWTIAHFVAMVGIYDVFDHLIEKNIRPLKTMRQKTILHVCCEYGNYELCKKILTHYEDIIYDKDDEDWNALHYAAKGGNLKVFKEVEKYFKSRKRLCELTRDERTVLHIACINKSIEICKYICNEKAYLGIIDSKGEFKYWTAAHYVAVEIKENGKEEELIRILVKSKIDLKAVTKDGLTVLGVACEHRNRNLINYLLKNHSELLGVGIPYLRNAANASNDENILLQINEALENYKGEKLDIIVER